jgi:hypothetical protein
MQLGLDFKVENDLKNTFPWVGPDAQERNWISGVMK